MTKHLACDADGTLWDSAREVYETLNMTWKETFGEEYPFNYDFYLKYIRPNISSIEDIVTETVIRLYSDFRIPEEMIGDRNLVSDYTKAKEKERLFYDIRKNQKDKNTEQWILSNPLYDGIPEMFEELEFEGVNTVILSSKDKDSILLILDHHDLMRYVNEMVIDKEYGKRPEQFSKFKETFPGEHFAYDDLLANLEHAKDAGIYPILAPQGYETYENKSKAIKKGIPITHPSMVTPTIKNEFVG